MKKKNLVAVIDIGSLATGMKVYSVSDSKVPDVVESLRAYLPLGSSTYGTGAISETDIAEVCRILSGFSLKCKEYKVDQTICVATSAFREAKNRVFALERIRMQTGFQVEILDNTIERFYRNLIVKETLPEFAEMAAAGTAILDIGSGSIQSTVYSDSAFVFSQNMSLGPLRIEEVYSGLERNAPDPQAVLEEHISSVLEDYHAIAPKGVKYKNLVVFGEETVFFKSLAEMDPYTSVEMDFQTFGALYAFLGKTPASELVLDHHIPSPAAGLLRPSVLLTKKTLEYSGAEKLFLPSVSLCDGIIYHYAWKNLGLKLRFPPNQDVLDAARHMGKRYRLDKKHAERVRAFALEIFGQTRHLHGLSDRERLLLEVSAILYEVGKHIHVTNYHVRSFHIIDTTEILGLTRTEQEIIANVARFCGESSILSNRFFHYMSEQKRNVVAKLAAILRLADALEASRKQKITNLKVISEGESLILSCEHQSDISYECWEADNRKDLFVEVYGVSPVLKPKKV